MSNDYAFVGGLDDPAETIARINMTKESANQKYKDMTRWPYSPDNARVMSMEEFNEQYPDETRWEEVQELICNPGERLMTYYSGKPRRRLML